MVERYPDDAVLLAIEADGATGVEYIPTGKTPYHLEFRRMLQRLLLAAQRANDLRVFQDGELTLGVRAGRCFVGGAARVFDGAQAVDVPLNTTTFLWLDGEAALQSGESLPADRTQFIPLAQVTTDGSTITSLTDLRGEAFLYSPALASLGLTATPEEINRALAGAAESVTAGALGRLTGGGGSTADSDHRHLQSAQDVAGQAYFSIVNISADPAANIVLAWSLPNRLLDAPTLAPNLANGFLQQAYDGVSFNLVGAVHAQFTHESALTASLTGKLLGGAPVSGRIVDVILSVGGNIASSNGADGVSATVKKNGVIVTTTSPAITAADGAGFRSTDRGDGTAAVMKSDGSELVERGDVLTVDLTRTASGTVSSEATDVVVLAVIRVDRPE